MNRIIGKSWRDSASLIVLNKRSRDLLSRRKQAGVNYEVLLQTRTSRASFPNSVVFPGGVFESSDLSADWIDHLRSFGYSDHDFNALHHCGDTVTPIFQPDPIKKHVALRITAIRETFEELGLLICSREHKCREARLWATPLTDVDVKYWQHQVSRNPEEFLKLCKEHNCYPDIWSLYYWSNWLTPVVKPKRFNTAFFITALENNPPKLESNSEVTHVQWSNPLEVLEKNDRKELELYPPQVYELNRLVHFDDIDELVRFAKQRSCHCNEVFYPIVIRASDGKLHVLPGDDLYQTNVDFMNATITEYKDKTVLELRQDCTCMHRFEVTYEPGLVYFVIQNYKPKHHINMGDKIIESRINYNK